MKEILADIKSKLQSGDCSNEEHVRLSLVAREMGSAGRRFLTCGWATHGLTCLRLCLQSHDVDFVPIVRADTRALSPASPLPEPVKTGRAGRRTARAVP